MPFSTVVFDLDGTILNTIEDLAGAGNAVCERHEWPTFSVDEYKRKVGNGMAKLVARFMPEGLADSDPALYEKVLAEFRAYYGAHKEDHTAPYPGIPELLDDLAHAGVQMGVLTNKDHVSAQPLLKQHFGDRFAYVQGKQDAYPAKPEAPATLHVLEMLGADPAHTLYVGDSDVDVYTGHNAGLKACGVLWGFRDRAELEGAGADFIAENPAALKRIVLGA